MASLPIACNRNAFDAAQTIRYRELVQQLSGLVSSVAELETGFAFSFPADADTCLTAMEFATLERRCCSFLTFELRVAPQNGPLTLTLTGPEGTQEILSEFVSRLRGNHPPAGT